MAVHVNVFPVVPAVMGMMPLAPGQKYPAGQAVMPLVSAVTAPGLVWAAMLLIMAYPGAKPVHAVAEAAFCPPALVVPVGHAVLPPPLLTSVPPGQ